LYEYNFVAPIYIESKGLESSPHSPTGPESAPHELALIELLEHPSASLFSLVRHIRPLVNHLIYQQILGFNAHAKVNLITVSHFLLILSHRILHMRNLFTN